MYSTPRTSIPFCDHSLPHHQCAVGKAHSLPTLPHRACYPRRSQQHRPYDANTSNLSSGTKAKPRAVSELGPETVTYPMRLGGRRNYSRPFLATPQRVKTGVLEEHGEATENISDDLQLAKAGANINGEEAGTADVETEEHRESRESGRDVPFSSFIVWNCSTPIGSDHITHDDVPMPLRNQSLSTSSRPIATMDTPFHSRRQHAKTQSLPFTPPASHPASSYESRARTCSLLLSFSSPPSSALHHSSPSFNEASTSTPPPPSPPPPAAHPLHSSPSLRYSQQGLLNSVTLPSAASARPTRPLRPRRPTLTSPSITTLRLFPALPAPHHQQGHGHGHGQPASPTTSLSSSHSGTGSLSTTLPLSSPYAISSLPTPGAAPFGVEGPHGFALQTSFFEDDEDDEKRGLMEYLRVRRSGSVRRSGGAGGERGRVGWWSWWVC